MISQWNVHLDSISYPPESKHAEDETKTFKKSSDHLETAVRSTRVSFEHADQTTMSLEQQRAFNQQRIPILKDSEHIKSFQYHSDWVNDIVLCNQGRNCIID